MARATKANGELQELAKCRITTPYGTVRLKVMPEITDSKNANYASETILGRSNPVQTFSHSEPRVISTELTFIVTTCADIEYNLRCLRILKSLAYPQAAVGGSPFAPPPSAKLYFGKFLGDGDTDGLCVQMKGYSVKTQKDVPYDVETYLPYMFTVSCQWEVVYSCANLPTSDRIYSLTNTWSCPPRMVDIA